MSEWQLQGPPPDPADLWLDAENVKNLRGLWEMECAGAWEDVERELLTNPAEVARLLDGEPLVVQINLNFAQALKALNAER